VGIEKDICQKSTMKKTNTLSILSLIELGARWYVCLTICAYGFGKIAGMQFGSPESMAENLGDLTISELTPMQIMWLFFGYSYGYGLFIGLSQVIGGLMLLHPRTKLLGITVLIPILLNIIVADLFFEVLFGATLTAIWLFVLLLFVLWYERVKVIAVFKALTANKFEWQSILNSPKELAFRSLAVIGGIVGFHFILQTFSAFF
jgi:hypothetical protein